MKIRIPEPCHEDWNEMSPNEQGRHCASCDKTVVDFTSMSDKQIAETLQHNVSSCGRFSRFQLDRNLVLHSEPQKHFGLLKLAACAILSVNLLNAHGQNPPENWVEVHQVDSPNDKESLPLDFNGIIKFKVSADQDKLDSLQYIHFQVQDFEMRFEQLDSNLIYEFHVPDSILWEKIEIILVARNLEDANFELSKEQWLKQYQSVNESIEFSFLNAWRIEDLIQTKPLILEPINICVVPNSLITATMGITSIAYYGDYIIDYPKKNTFIESPQTELHPPIFIDTPEPIDEDDLIDEHSGIFPHNPSQPESKGSLWKVLYYVLFAGIVGFFTRWAYRKSKEK